jgi:hypothetical protein
MLMEKGKELNGVHKKVHNWKEVAVVLSEYLIVLILMINE